MKLTGIDRNILEIENAEIIDGTPLLDIKPYVPEMEEISRCKISWMSLYSEEVAPKKSDKRIERSPTIPAQQSATEN